MSCNDVGLGETWQEMTATSMIRSDGRNHLADYHISSNLVAYSLNSSCTLCRSKLLTLANACNMKTVTTLTSIPILLATLASANPGAVACDHIRVDKRSYDFSNLDAPHSVWVVDEDSPPAVYNTTWTVNICSQLELDKEHKDEQCKKGTNSKIHRFLEYGKR